MKNIFEKSTTSDLENRINKLNSSTQPQWGSMSVSQMLAHCNVTYELVFENIHPKPTGFKKFMLKLFVKNIVVSEKPYAKNSRTAEEFLVSNDKDFEKEKVRLVAYVIKTQELGASHFEGKESHAFGNLSSQEWNNLFYKHLDHHLNQFGV